MRLSEVRSLLWSSHSVWRSCSSKHGLMKQRAGPKVGEGDFLKGKWFALRECISPGRAPLLPSSLLCLRTLIPNQEKSMILKTKLVHVLWFLFFVFWARIPTEHYLKTFASYFIKMRRPFQSKLFQMAC